MFLVSAVSSAPAAQCRSPSCHSSSMSLTLYCTILDQLTRHPWFRRPRPTAAEQTKISDNNYAADRHRPDPGRRRRPAGDRDRTGTSTWTGPYHKLRGTDPYHNNPPPLEYKTAITTRCTAKAPDARAWNDGVLQHPGAGRQVRTRRRIYQLYYTSGSALSRL